MADEPNWDDIFTTQPQAAAEQPTEPADGDGLPTRRSARREPTARRPRRSERQDRVRDRGPRKRRRWIPWLISIVVVLGLGAGATAVVWANYEDQIRKVLGWELPPADFEGSGTGEATIVINSGDNGAAVARALLEANVIASFDAFYDLLLADPNVQFFPGFYVLKEQMSAQAALDALQDPANRVENTALIQEGKSKDQAFEILSAATEIPIEEFQAEAEDLASFGIPAEAPSIEGYLFPATYTFDPGVTARSVLERLVNRTFESLDAAGVAPEDRHRVLTIASLIQREAGSKAEDFYKVSRVVQNRVKSGMLLQFDSTSHYGYAWAHGERLDGGVFSNTEELTDDNPYNTYVHAGLPIGPIGAAGDLAIRAALEPADGAWLYFVTVNLETGETVFSDTLSQHNAAVKQLQQWCRDTRSPTCG
ncbi:endolytic transglycosylase MltG [Cryobacterium sp. BB307]|uniref:endolytic transglycosylase MltG n=1 Tax=Cryobacterium sp. BB307 TaxID=2716317 RepID=UPI00144605D1